MCTTFTYLQAAPYYGRNMDIDTPFGEQFVLIPRECTSALPAGLPVSAPHHQLCGVASVFDGVALFAEAVNEHGLYMASLNFPQNAVYSPADVEGAINLAPYEVIPYFVAKFASVEEALPALDRLNIVARPYGQLPLAPLHYFISDGRQHRVIEPTRFGLKVYEDKLGVLTNNPPYPWQMQNVQQYQHLTIKNPTEGWLPEVKTAPFGEGLGLVGLPGDFSPPSRFVKTAFLKQQMERAGDSVEPMADVLHILNAVAMLRGSVRTAEDRWDITRYSIAYDPVGGRVCIQTYDRVVPQMIDLKQAFEGLESAQFMPL